MAVMPLGHVRRDGGEAIDGKTVKEALLISAGEVITRLKGLPEDHLHCSILSVSTLYRAIADYLLKK